MNQKCSFVSRIREFTAREHNSRLQQLGFKLAAKPLMPEEILKRILKVAKHILDELEYTQFVMALEDEFDLNIED